MRDVERLYVLPNSTFVDELTGIRWRDYLITAACVPEKAGELSA